MNDDDDDNGKNAATAADDSDGWQCFSVAGVVIQWLS